MFNKKLGIDLGTANILVSSPKNGIILEEPSVVCIDQDTKKVLTVGKEAKKMVGRTPEKLTASRPLKDGVIAEYETTQALLDHSINKTTGLLKFLKPDLIISIPAGITSSERRAVKKAANRVGTKNTYLIKEPLLAAIGAGVDINKAVGNLIIDIGGGTTEIACISLGSIVHSKSIKVGGDKMDRSIKEFIHSNYKVHIGNETAEKIKKRIGTATKLKKEKKLEIQAQDVLKGLPKQIELRSNLIKKAISRDLNQIVETLKDVLKETPPELVADIVNKGIILTGGGAKLSNLEQLIEKSIGVKAYRAENSELCVAKGIIPVLKELEYYKDNLSQERIYN